MFKTDETVQKLIDGYAGWFKDDALLESGRMTNALYPYDAMFSPITVNGVKLKNRLVMAPMGNISMCEETGRPNAKMLEYFLERAKGGVGLITSGLIPVSHGQDPTITELGALTYFPRIDRSRTVFAAWRDLAAGVHSYGAKFFIQLTPGLGRVGNPQCLINSHKFPRSASLNPSFYIPQIPCLPMSAHRLNKIIKNTGQAAADSKAALIDGVYLHGHEGYLLEQMTNPAFNRRRLGKYADYQAFGIDMVKEIRRRVGSRYPIMYRIDLSLALNETYGEEGMSVKSLRKFKNGRSVAQTLDYIKNLISAGVDIIDVDLGCYDNWWLPHPPGPMPPGCFLDVARLVKDYLAQNNILSNAGLTVPVVAVGKLGYPDLAERALRESMCDMVMLGRPLLADPQWPNKAFTGRVSQIRPCIGCQEGCINEFVEGGHPQCAVNARTGFEDVYPAVPAKAVKQKKVAVVGAGPAGITLALTAAERGHAVTLIEESEKPGGKLIPGGTPKIKYDVENYRRYLEYRLNEAPPGLEFKTGRKACVDELASGGYDAICFCIGSKDLRLELPGAHSANIISASELLSDPGRIKDATRAVVIGAGAVGCETAYYLRYELGLEVAVLEMTPLIMNKVCTANRGFLIHYLQKGGVKLINCARVTRFEKGEAVYMRNVSDTVPDPYITWHPILPENVENPLAKKLKTIEREERIKADIFVTAAGGGTNDGLYFEAVAKRAAPELYNLGDGFAPGKVLEAVKSAYAVALSL